MSSISSGSAISPLANCVETRAFWSKGRKGILQLIAAVGRRLQHAVADFFSFSDGLYRSFLNCEQHGVFFC